MADDVNVNTTGLMAHPSRLSASMPVVQGTCPACHARSLFLAQHGYVTCAVAECPDPTAAGSLLEPGGEAALAASPIPDVPCEVLLANIDLVMALRQERDGWKAQYEAAYQQLNGGAAGPSEELESWDGLMEQLDRYYPADLMANWPDDPGPRVVALIRQIDAIRHEAALRTTKEENDG